MTAEPVSTCRSEDGCANASMECRICWHVYDPWEGDELRQVAPGTPFSALPDDWCCPNCDAAKTMFLAIV